MNPALINQPFIQVALPVMVTMVVAVWAQASTNNRRLDDIAARIGRVEDRLGRIEERLTLVERKVDILETKTWSGR